MLPDPVAPQKKIFVALGGIAGILTGLSLSIFYDKNTDHIWIHHSERVSLKAFSSFSYHHLSKSTLIERCLSNIDDIGSSDNYVWFRRADYIVAANPFSGKFIPISKVEDSVDSIIWGSSMFGYAVESINRCMKF